MHSSRSLLGFGLLSLSASLALTILILSTGVTLLLDHLRPGQNAIWPILMFTCAAGGLTCVLLSGLQFVQLAASRRAARHGDLREAHWTQALLGWAYSGTPLPETLDRTGAETLLRLRDNLQGEVSDRLRDLYVTAGWLAGDLQRLQRRRLPVMVRAEVIERLALLRHPVALEALRRELRSPRREVRALALLALSRSVGRLPLSRSQGLIETLSLQGAVTSGGFSVGQVQEALTLLGSAGQLLSRDLLLGANDTLRVATLEVLARNRSRDLHLEVTRLLTSANAEVRSAALKVLARGGFIPNAAQANVLALTQDAVAFVRLQATQALNGLSPLPAPQLWTLLGDPNWWVRRAAAQTLTASAEGLSVLRRAAQDHPDRYGQDMARTTLEARQSPDRPA